MVDRFLNGFIKWAADQVVDMLGGVLAFLTSAMFLSPDVTVLPQVQMIAARSALIVNACFGLAIVTVGIAVMVSGSVETRYKVKDLIPRLVVGFALSTFAVPLCSVVIEVANALTVSMVGPATPTVDAVKMARTHVIAALADSRVAVVALLVGVLIVGLLFTLVVGWLVRVGVLIILAAVSPLALAGFSLPWTEALAQLWWRALLGCLVTPTLQAITLSIGIELILDPRSSIPVLIGLPQTDLLNLLVVVVVLWVTVAIPGFVRRLVKQAPGRNLGAVAARAVMYRSLGRQARRQRQTPATRVHVSNHTHHHYRRLRRGVLNRES
ncbi:hypothetical protein SAMN05421812_102643 [Asanoa hainanensis]|uniref:Uncharacterized protein n=1 Tax=Asanoa hainanensis TaxID=560556 RepID=A0A239IZ69_9ACTN|nr:hypothetical protein [Asanoa hainanensis]SNS98849.1 hypothetical protein SAMN05421812_102643 [Asanoa hainanensis]